MEVLGLFLRHLAPARQSNAPKIVLDVHGGTFPSGLSIAHRFDGRSWRDELCACGFDVWGLDFLGFGGSDRYAQMAEPAENRTALGGAIDASRQMETAVRWICMHHGVASISIIVLFSIKTRWLLGVHVVGEGATELIHIGQAVLNLKGTLDYFIENTFNCPTLAEAKK